LSANLGQRTCYIYKIYSTTRRLERVSVITLQFNIDRGVSVNKGLRIRLIHRQVRSNSDTDCSDNKMNISVDMVLTMIGLILALLQLASAVMTVFQNRDLLKTLRQAGLVSVLFIYITLKTRPNILQRGHKAESIYALPTLPALNAPMFQGSKCKYFGTPLLDAPGSHHVITDQQTMTFHDSKCEHFFPRYPGLESLDFVGRG